MFGFTLLKVFQVYSYVGRRLKGSFISRRILLLHWDIKGALSGMRQLLATESPLKIMKNVFFHLKIFKDI